MAGCHTSTYKGKRVFIRFKNGSTVIGKFKDSKSNYIHLDIGKINIKDIKSFSINKNGKPSRQTTKIQDQRRTTRKD